MRNFFLIAIIIVSYGSIHAQPHPHYKLITGNSIVQSKNYYLLTLLQHDDAVRKLLESDTVLASIAINKLNNLLPSGAACGNPVCITERMLFTEKERENAADYEPMFEKVNKAAFNRIKLVKWDAYKYTLILVPGAGPEDPNVPLSAEGMLRCRLAAVQYRKGLAPFAC